MTQALGHPFSGSTEPWVCALRIQTAAGKLWTATGCLIAPAHVLTAAHNLFRREYANPPTTTGEWAQSIDVIPGCEPQSDPFGRFASSKFFCDPSWTSSFDDRWDYGLIRLSASVLGVSPASMDGSVVGASTLTGYPGTNLGRLQVTQSVTTQPDAIYFLRYNAQTQGGDSGSPVWTPGSNVQGIHIRTDRARRIDGALKAQVNAWMTFP